MPLAYKEDRETLLYDTGSDQIAGARPDKSNTRTTLEQCFQRKLLMKEGS